MNTFDKIAAAMDYVSAYFITEQLSKCSVVEVIDNGVILIHLKTAYHMFELILEPVDGGLSIKTASVHSTAKGWVMYLTSGDLKDLVKLFIEVANLG